MRPIHQHLLDRGARLLVHAGHEPTLGVGDGVKQPLGNVAQIHDRSTFGTNRRTRASALSLVAGSSAHHRVAGWWRIRIAGRGHVRATGMIQIHMDPAVFRLGLGMIACYVNLTDE